MAIERRTRRINRTQDLTFWARIRAGDSAQDASHIAGFHPSHWHAPIMLRDPHRLEDPLINVLAAVARCLEFEDALAVWDSAANRGLIGVTGLQRFPLVGIAKQLVKQVTPYSDSGLETFVKLRLKRFRLKICAQGLHLSA